MTEPPAFPEFPVLETPRLILRAATSDDAEAVFAIFADEEVTRYHDLSTFTSLEEALGVIERRARRFANGQGIRWGIVRKGDNTLIGSCGFGAWDKQAHRAEIGYELARNCWGQGIMTEALQAILPFGFERMGLHEVVAEVMLQNTASMRVLTKLGFRDEGILPQRGYWKGEHHDLKRFVLERVRAAQKEEHSMLDISDHYNEGLEQERLSSGVGLLEYARTQELLQRYLPTPPAIVLDVGGGAGIYSFWLASLGYAVHLVDAMPLHIAQATQTASQPESPALASLAVGDARRLDFADGSADAVLLMGPLYHLTERADRLLALQEAYRTLRPGGVVCAVGISRFASLLDGLSRGFLLDPEFENIMTQDLATGQHRNPNDHPHYFTTAFFHHQEELDAEVREAGFSEVRVLGIEGPAWLTPHFTEFWADIDKREALLRGIRAVETEPTLLGVSAHLLAVGQKPE